MKLQVKEMTDTSVKLVVEGVNHAFVNALRRTLLAEVPKMSIEDVTIYDNTSALFDEVIAHRLGLVPIPTDLQAFVRREECTCNNEGCSNCTILYTLSKEGPTMVVSGDLTPADPRFRIKDPGIPIVKLLEGQRLMLEAAAVMNTGTADAKWAPVHGAAYKELPRVEIRESPAIAPEVLSEIARNAPPGAISVENGKVAVLDEEKAYQFFRSAKRVWPLEAVRVSTEREKFIFFFETDGSISPKEALQRAVSILMEKLKVVESEAPKLKLEEEPASPA